jgi:hypothetical protein
MRTASVLLLFAFVGCNDDRLAKLEKQTAALEIKLAQAQKSSQLDIQAKCAKDSKAWFDQNGSGDQGARTRLLVYTNHYSVAKNRCFISVEYRFSLGFPEEWHKVLSLNDIYENQKYGEFRETHNGANTTLSGCVVYGKQCDTMQEYQSLAAAYMNN